MFDRQLTDLLQRPGARHWLVRLARAVVEAWIVALVFAALAFAGAFGGGRVHAQDESTLGSALLGPGPLLLRGATVIDGVERGDGSGWSPRPADLLIEDGRIAVVATPGEITAPEGTRSLDLTGRFVVPGFVDSHAHVALGPVRVEQQEGGIPTMTMQVDAEVGPRSLRSLLASGVTSARDPGGSTARNIALREAVATGAVPGPVLTVAGEVIDTTAFDGLTVQVTSLEAVRAEVRRQAELGVDLIKLYAGLAPEMLRAGVDEASRHGLPAVAHLLMSTWREGAEAGLHSILHAVPGSPKMLPAEQRAAYMKDLHSTLFLLTWFEFVDFESPEIAATIEALVRLDTWVDPTLVVFEAAAFGDRPEYTVDRPELALAAESLVENWRTSFRFDQGWDEDAYRRAQAAWPRALEWVRRLHEAGVRLTAGTDANNPWTVPGPSFHRELELLVEAGIPTVDVLRIATRNGAEALGRLAETGTLEAGKRADLVVLRSSPLERISATREIELVVQGGRLWCPSDLVAAVPVGAQSAAASRFCGGPGSRTASP
ncbi:MAG: hypothetical protein DWQ36_20075 [Acidobacteria bacterium]|nr:MAG: hypothetical protein DWQ30_08290 [Acidobacteriota bacterium]REK03586.1 MAG: hypothetical protein DWQ36_20075 [Acidobacteriota bacterium]